MALVGVPLAVWTAVVVLLVMAAVFVVRLLQRLAYFVPALRPKVRDDDKARCLVVYPFRLVAGQLLVAPLVVAVVVRLTPETPVHQLVVRVAAVLPPLVLPRVAVRRKQLQVVAKAA